LDSGSNVSTEIDIHFIKNIWDGIFLQSEVIAADAQNFIDYKQGDIHPTVAIENGDNVFIGGGASVRAGSVLDASAGPIIIAEEAYIDIGSLIQGPVYIGPNCVINPGTKLRGNVTLGPYCKIGGEVEDVIFQGYSNKQHDGFLGHSYIGEWVNLGANTNNSDLKNNYGLIKLFIGEQEIKTGEQFLGTMMGDYSRTGISTMLNTGTIVGLGANIFGEGFQDKYIPSFRWGKNDTTELEKFFSTIEKMKQRRGKSLSSNEKNYLTKLFEKQLLK
jgi:UDP-N-acetylglucosamine diphosphorylase/glucosamine-1-phosphate N-acetyltransferase